MRPRVVGGLVIQVDLEVLTDLVRGLAELLERAPERPADLWETLRPEHDQGDDEDDDELFGTDAEHWSSMALSGLLPAEFTTGLFRELPAGEALQHVLGVLGPLADVVEEGPDVVPKLRQRTRQHLEAADEGQDDPCHDGSGRQPDGHDHDNGQHGRRITGGSSPSRDVPSPEGWPWPASRRPSTGSGRR